MESPKLFVTLVFRQSNLQLLNVSLRGGEHPSVVIDFRVLVY